MKQIRKSQYRSVGITCLLLVVVIVTYLSNSSNITGNVIRQLSEGTTSRPRIFTFYEEANNGQGGIVDYGEGQNLLQTWETLWSEAGWQPVVLTMGHAKKHPMYQNFHDLFTTKGIKNEYEYYCFMRWLAVSHAGGGWMSDYDTFPLEISPEDGFNLPNGGEFTSHNGMTPALLSGSNDEWLRIVGEMYKILEEKGAKDNFHMKYGKTTFFFSDMIALDEIRKKGQRVGKILFKFTRDVRDFPLKNAFECDCENAKSYKAMHLSHSSAGSAWEAGALSMLIPDGKQWYHRSSYANQIVKLWKTQCTGNDSELKTTRD